MNLIQNYQNYNVLERIIFWGKFVIVLLLIVLIITTIIKKKKQTKVKTIHFSDDIPIITDEQKEELHEEIFIEEPIPVTEGINLDLLNDDVDAPKVEVKVEEPLAEESQVEPVVSEIKEEKKYKTDFEMPTAPYQRNVLREMSLSQTSPIGINRKDTSYTKKEEPIKELEEVHNVLEVQEEIIQEKPQEIVETNLEVAKPVVEITEEPIVEEIMEEVQYEDEFDEVPYEYTVEEEIEETEDIERTQYEIEQEENAIISYKELMEKKDSIQTIDEEEAIISIEELLNKTSSKKEVPKEESKLYNITEEEENDSFLNELKKFRKDL